VGVPSLSLQSISIIYKCFSLWCWWE